MNFKNAEYLKDGRIKCEVEHPKLGWIPYTASKDDSEEFGKKLFKILSKSKKVSKYVPKTPSNEDVAKLARAERDAKLRKLDTIVMNPLRWDSFSDDEKETYKKYRQDLLDVPQQEGFPHNIQWPSL